MCVWGGAQLHLFFLAVCLCDPSPERAVSLAAALPSAWFTVSLTHACIYRIQVLNHSKQVEWMKSSDKVAVIVPIRALLMFLLLSYGQWSGHDRQIITFQGARQVRCFFFCFFKLLLFFYLTVDKVDKEQEGRKVGQFILDAKAKPLSGCFTVCPPPQPIQYRSPHSSSSRLQL